MYRLARIAAQAEVESSTSLGARFKSVADCQAQVCRYRITDLTAAQLPPDWRNIPAPSALAAIGDRWFQGRDTAILAVPSAIVPVEYNYLVNPTHPDFAKSNLESPQPFELDPRLWKNDR